MLLAIDCRKSSGPGCRVPVEARCSLAILEISLVRTKEENLVLDDRAAGADAREVALDLRFFEVGVCLLGCPAESVKRNKVLVQKLRERVRLPFVCPGLGHCGNDCARRFLIFGLEVRGGNAEFLQRIPRERIARPLRPG